MEDVKVREMQIFDYKKKIAEAETKLKQQQVRSLVLYFKYSRTGKTSVYGEQLQTHLGFKSTKYGGGKTMERILPRIS